MMLRHRRHLRPNAICKAFWPPRLLMLRLVVLSDDDLFLDVRPPLHLQASSSSLYAQTEVE